MSKVRYVDFNPAELLADTAGELTLDEFSLYWMICTLIYSRRQRIDDDPEWLQGKFKKADVRRIRTAIEGLVAKEKVIRIEGKLTVNRCENELERARKRIETAQENGRNGGRPAKDINHLNNQGGLLEESYNQPPTTITNHHIYSASGDAAMNGHQVNGTNGHHAEPVTGGQLTLLPKGPKPDRKKPRTAWPADFTLNSEMATYCRTKLPATRPQALFEEFQNYHTAQGSIFASWPAAWRTWVDNAAKRAAGVRR